MGFSILYHKSIFFFPEKRSTNFCLHGIFVLSLDAKPMSEIRTGLPVGIVVTVTQSISTLAFET